MGGDSNRICMGHSLFKAPLEGRLFLIRATRQAISHHLRRKREREKRPAEKRGGKSDRMSRALSSYACIEYAWESRGGGGGYGNLCGGGGVGDVGATVSDASFSFP